MHHQRPSDASCDGPASSAQAGTTPSRSETHVGTWRCAGDSRGTTAPCVVAQLVRCGGGGRRGTDARRHGGSMLQKPTKLDPVAWCHPFIHLMVTIKPVDAFVGKGQQKPPWRRLAPLVLGLGRRMGGTAPRSFDSPKSCARPDSWSRISHERE